MIAAFGVSEVRIRGFRSARSLHFAPGAVCALVGGPSVGKSNVLAAIWTLLQQGSPAPEVGDVTADDTAAIRLSATLADGDELTLDATPPGDAVGRGPAVPVLFLPASERSGALVAGPTQSPTARRIADTYFTPTDAPSSAAPAAALVGALERLCDAGEHGVVLLIEEPELFLRPQAQRYLYRLLRTFASNGNQVLYSTHQPAFLSVGRLDELALVDYSTRSGTTIVQPQPLPTDESFRALSELDAERSELFLARAVLLVEGRTEKMTLPFVLHALGYDVDREAITIVECGGKPNIPLFIRICQSARIPYLVVYDRDAPPGRKPKHAERIINAQITQLAGPGRTVALAPDFEAIAGLRGHSHKPARAWERFSHVKAQQVPADLRDIAERIVALARR